MILIDLANRKPTDCNIPGWNPWTKEKWDAWLEKSNALLEQMKDFEDNGNREARNALIDANSEHWGQLKPWLLKLSGGKCWFSEVRDLYSHYDVEHFRPKKESRRLDGVKGDGYWWLAFNHMNFRVCGNVGNRKKGGWFPLKANTPCSSYAVRCEESEARYLLDPIDDNDVSLIAFDEEGKVVPVPWSSEWEKERVAVTVERLKLNEHASLAEERRKIWHRIDALLSEFQDVASRCGHGANPGAEEKLRQIRISVRAMTAQSAELSSVARWCIYVRNNSQFSRLVA